MQHGGITESRDCYDLIEWVGTRPWCNGKVGLSGVSYLAAIQYQVAPLRPPHLAAINPWEGFTDWYREFAYHGGIRETELPAVRDQQHQLVAEPHRRHPRQRAGAPALRRVLGEQGESISADIEVPAFVVASWSDQGLHTRGTLDGYRQIGRSRSGSRCTARRSGGTSTIRATCAQLQTFFDHFLKGTDDTVLGWPKVRIEVRERAYVQAQRAEAEWPLQRQRLLPLYLDAASAHARCNQARSGSTAKVPVHRQGRRRRLSTTSSRKTPKSPAT